MDKKRIEKRIKIVTNILIEKGTSCVYWIFALVNVFMIINAYILKIDVIDEMYHKYLYYIQNNILTEDGKDLLVNILSIISGFVITIISVFGVEYSKATIKICENNLQGKFISISKQIMYISIILLAIILFLYDVKTIDILAISMFLSVIYVIIKFMIFGMIVFKMFDYNMDNCKVISNKEEEQEKEIIILLRKIANSDEINIGNYNKSKKYNENVRNKNI